MDAARLGRGLGKCGAFTGPDLSQGPPMAPAASVPQAGGGSEQNSPLASRLGPRSCQVVLTTARAVPSTQT